MKPEERLIVAADFRPIHGEDSCESVRRQVLGLADLLQSTGVYLKVNSALRACGFKLIEAIHSRGLKVFADLKLFDIGETMSIDGALISKFKPDLLTTVCYAGVKGLSMLKASLPDTEVLGVTVLTSIRSTGIEGIHGGLTLNAAVQNLAEIALQGNLDGLICSAHEVSVLRQTVGEKMTINTPGIRPAWGLVQDDDQARIMTPAKAIMAGADRLVIGRPITQPPPGMTIRDAVKRTIEEIASVTS